ncbi:MAG: hypothetical protein NTZ97_01640 [Candidatus Moranbacteria bacterium]|nr:hypothetical protein [Candidatus Moranbacteria bacterium]
MQLCPLFFKHLDELHVWPDGQAHFPVEQLFPPEQFLTSQQIPLTQLPLAQFEAELHFDPLADAVACLALGLKFMFRSTCCPELMVILTDLETYPIQLNLRVQLPAGTVRR